jgi:starch phosphorylase
MKEAITDKWWPFTFGSTADEIKKMILEKSYNPVDFYLKHQNIQKTVNMLKDGSLVKNEHEHNALLDLYNVLLAAEIPDKFFVIKDLLSFYETQKKVEELYLDKNKWFEYVFHNIGGMNRFSSDEVINNYTKSIWNIEPCPLKQDILEKATKEYQEISYCYVYKK